MRTFRSMALAVLALSVSVIACAQFVISTVPSPPPANQAFQVYVTGAVPGGASPQFSPVISVSGNMITVELHAEDCMILCPPPSTATKRFTMSALSPGQYTLTVYVTDSRSPPPGT